MSLLRFSFVLFYVLRVWRYDHEAHSLWPAPSGRCIYWHASGGRLNRLGFWDTKSSSVLFVDCASNRGVVIRGPSTQGASVISTFIVSLVLGRSHGSSTCPRATDYCFHERLGDAVFTTQFLPSVTTKAFVFRILWGLCLLHLPLGVPLVSRWSQKQICWFEWLWGFIDPIVQTVDLWNLKNFCIWKNSLGAFILNNCFISTYGIKKWIQRSRMASLGDFFN